MEDKVTFSGKEPVKLDMAKLTKAIEALRSYVPPDLSVHHISYNLARERFLEVFNAVESAPDEASNAAFFGWPIYKKSYVPLGEVWLQNKDGEVIKKFSFPI